MRIAGRNVSKRITTAQVKAALPKGWHLVRINWKKGGKVFARDTHGRLIQIPIGEYGHDTIREYSTVNQ
jgi:hypothetical protein